MKFSEDVVASHLRGLSGHNKRGEEIPDPKPLEMPLGFEKPVPLAEELRRLLSQQLQNELQERGIETFDDANDFEIEDSDEDMSAPYEENFDPLHTFAHEQEIRAGAVEAPNFKEAREITEKLKKKPAEPEKEQPSTPT